MVTLGYFHEGELRKGREGHDLRTPRNALSPPALLPSGNPGSMPRSWSPLTTFLDPLQRSAMRRTLRWARKWIIPFWAGILLVLVLPVLLLAEEAEPKAEPDQPSDDKGEDK